MDKQCSKCKLSKSLDAFYKRSASKDGLQSVCKNCSDKKRNEIRDAKWDAYIEYARSYSERFRERDRSRKTRYVTNRCRTDIQFRLSMYLRNRLRTALKKNIRCGSAVRDLGCTLDELRVHLESLFKPGMTWDNHGKWHIDHIVPLCSFDLTDREQLLKACHYTNLQPLWSEENLSKGGRNVSN